MPGATRSGDVAHRSARARPTVLIDIANVADMSWAVGQIAREQVPMLGDAVGTELAPTDYHRVAEGYGGRGFLLERPEDVPEVLAAALAASRAGSPVLVNARIGRSEFRKGSLSM